MEPDTLASPSDTPAAKRWAGHPGELPPSDVMPDPAVEIALPGIPATNGHAHVNGHTISHTNGHANGHANGHSNGHANGHTNGHLRVLPGSRPRLAAIAVDHNGRQVAIAVDETLAALDARETGSLYLRWGKRALDVAGAIAALIVCLPVLAIAALAIRLEGRGPILYRSTRIGRSGRAFTFYKLRSMVQDADRHRHRLKHLNECDGPVFKISRDPRVTRVGRFLRTTSIDEIPQFLNVLRGDMSLVGPRPPLPEEVAQYEPWQLRRLDVRPGITCLWQISGRSRIGFHEWMRLDLEYIRHQSFALDVEILLRTIPAVLSREGAY